MIHLFEDGNSELKGKMFVIPDNVKKHLQATLSSYQGNKDEKFVGRLTNLINDGQVSYSEMKRIKNYFDNFVGDPKQSQEFKLNGGNVMKTWVNSTLGNATRQVHDYKEAKKNAGMKNAFIRPHEKNRKTKNATKVSTPKVNTNKSMTSNVADDTTIRFESKRSVLFTKEQLNRILESYQKSI